MIIFVHCSCINSSCFMIRLTEEVIFHERHLRSMTTVGLWMCCTRGFCFKEKYLICFCDLIWRLATFGQQNRREAYNVVIVTEHLLTHGPLSASPDQFQCDRETMEEMCQLQYVDEEEYDVIFIALLDLIILSSIKKLYSFETFMISVGFTNFNWRLSIRNKTERVLKLIEGGHFLEQERDRVHRQISCRIQRFGCFSPSCTFEVTDSDYKGHAQREEMTPLLDWKYKS